ncbi:MAG TPA: saccharopine dehydrogenase C-terminal domain-containing protein [Blastocatellia bacterium]|nr:saccharopine dehydrogenase C-terminal domain-containing protein [Blastocatellia bacterium]
MKILVIGAGRMGLGAAFDLANSPDVEAVTVADIYPELAEKVVSRIGSPKLSAAVIDVNDYRKTVEMMRGHNAAISCVVYKHNLALAMAAIESKVSFCDLGGNNSVVDSELALDGQAREAGINIIPDCGLAPGLVSLLVAHGAARFERLNKIRIRVGGLPQRPKGPLEYQITFSVEGLINEYVEPARVIRGGRIVEIESMTEVETLEFPPPFGTMEAFQTSGGASTLPDSFLGSVEELDYKTIRYPGHCERFKLLIDLGLASSRPINIDGMPVAPRSVLAELLLRHFPSDEPDVVLIRIEFAGREGGRDRLLTYDLADYFDEKTGLSAMMRMTAFPVSIIAQMMARGEISPKGAIPQEKCVPVDIFVAALAERGIRISERLIDS